MGLTAGRRNFPKLRCLVGEKKTPSVLVNMFVVGVVVGIYFFGGEKNWGDFFGLGSVRNLFWSSNLSVKHRGDSFWCPFPAAFGHQKNNWRPFGSNQHMSKTPGSLVMQSTLQRRWGFP